MHFQASSLGRRDGGSEPWRVGVLFSRSGFMALIEETQYRGTMIAIEEINQAGGINGREVVPEVWDPQSDNSLFKAHARRMLAESGVKTIFGCYTSSSRKAVLKHVAGLKGESRAVARSSVCLTECLVFRSEFISCAMERYITQIVVYVDEEWVGRLDLDIPNPNGCFR